MIRAIALVVFMTACSTTAQTKHVTAGAGIASLTYAVTESPGKACLSAIGAGVGKELYDLTGRGHPAVSDVIVTALAPCIMVYIVDYWRLR